MRAGARAAAGSRAAGSRAPLHAARREGYCGPNTEGYGCGGTITAGGANCGSFGCDNSATDGAQLRGGRSAYGDCEWAGGGGAFNRAGGGSGFPAATTTVGGITVTPRGHAYCMEGESSSSNINDPAVNDRWILLTNTENHC
jgi:hypothetical protein